ncbi:MAG: hypothetical protein U1E77_06585 [Inhella sp.]
MTLKAARKARDEARRTRETGANPVQQRKAAKLEAQINSATTFEAVARECHAAKASGWSDTYARRWLERMEKDLFPHLGALPLADIKAPLLLQVLRRWSAKHRDRAHAAPDRRPGVPVRHPDRQCESNPAPDLLAP